MRPQATHVQTLRPKDAGLSLIETLIVLVIIGLVSAMIVPKVIGRPDEARITVARNDIAVIASALKMYRLDNRAYPSTAQGLSALVQRPSGSPQPANWHPEGYLDETLGGTFTSTGRLATKGALIFSRSGQMEKWAAMAKTPISLFRMGRDSRAVPTVPCTS